MSGGPSFRSTPLLVVSLLVVTSAAGCIQMGPQPEAVLPPPVVTWTRDPCDPVRDGGPSLNAPLAPLWRGTSEEIAQAHVAALGIDLPEADTGAGVHQGNVWRGEGISVRYLPLLQATAPPAPFLTVVHEAPSPFADEPATAWLQARLQDLDLPEGVRFEIGESGRAVSAYQQWQDRPLLAQPLLRASSLDHIPRTSYQFGPPYDLRDAEDTIGTKTAIDHAVAYDRCIMDAAGKTARGGYERMGAYIDGFGVVNQSLVHVVSIAYMDPTNRHCDWTTGSKVHVDAVTGVILGRMGSGCL